MFPNGEPGWHEGILKKDRTQASSSTEPQQMLDISTCTSFDQIMQQEAQIKNTTSKSHTVSCREYYVYKLQIRLNDTSYLLRFGRLFQQFIIDNYIKLETMRLEYIRYQQKNMRQEQYQGVVDSVASGIELGGRVGTRIYLPATFIGGPSDMKQRYEDSMALVQEYGKPDIFLTMTCNPKWPEIKEAQNRPDLTARVLKSKLGILHDKIMNGEIFGNITSVVHVVEFQKI